ncbi:hypothetical protein chiPu_0031996, partial [Chiloscyllium punctatum]|nr:hypothetical protein [Chiloscyllium punctatum]
ARDAAGPRPAGDRSVDKRADRVDVGLDRRAAPAVFRAFDVPILQQRLDQRGRQRDLIDREHAAGDALPEDAGDDLLGHHLHLDGTLAFRRWKRLRFHEAEHEPGLHRLAHADMGGDDPVQVLAGILLDVGGRLVEDLRRRLGDLAEDHRQQRRLAVEIGIEAAHAEAGGLRKLAQRGGVKTVLVGQRQRGADDAREVGDGEMR